MTWCVRARLSTVSRAVAGGGAPGPRLGVQPRGGPVAGLPVPDQGRRCGQRRRVALAGPAAAPDSGRAHTATARGRRRIRRVAGGTPRRRGGWQCRAHAPPARAPSRDRPRRRRRGHANKLSERAAGRRAGPRARPVVAPLLANAEHRQHRHAGKHDDDDDDREQHGGATAAGPQRTPHGGPAHPIGVLVRLRAAAGLDACPAARPPRCEQQSHARRRRRRRRPVAAATARWEPSAVRHR